MADAPDAPRPAQPGGHELRREVVAHHQRRRILRGAAAVFSEEGYQSVRVSDIVKGAAIARATFYENFGSKQDCFFGLYDQTTAAALGAVEQACERAEGDFPHRVRTALAALLAEIEADPTAARATIVEGPAVGAAIDERFERLVSDFAGLLRRGRGEATAADLPATVEETVIGGLYWLLYYALLEEDPKPIGKLAPQLVEFALIPFIGADAAHAAVGPG
jgi:AcrR family transcriptional regulator